MHNCVNDHMLQQVMELTSFSSQTCLISRKLKHQETTVYTSYEKHFSYDFFLTQYSLPQ
jgi:hypothetical protein